MKWEFNRPHVCLPILSVCLFLLFEAGGVHFSYAYGYNSLNLRTQDMLADEHRYLHDQWNPIGELDAANGVVRHYLWGADLSGSRHGAGGVGGLVKMYDAQSSEHYFPAYDGNGNVIGLARGSDGAMEDIYEYGPFGEALRVSGAVAESNPIRFSTKYTDVETDLDFIGPKAPKIKANAGTAAKTGSAPRRNGEVEIEQRSNEGTEMETSHSICWLIDATPLELVVS